MRHQLKQAATGEERSHSTSAETGSGVRNILTQHQLKQAVTGEERSHSTSAETGSDG